MDTRQSSTTWLGLCLCLLLLLFLALFLGFLVLLFLLPLERLLLLLRLRNGFEEALQSGLLTAPQFLLQLSGSCPDTILAEAFLVDQKLHQAFHIRLFPLEVAQRIVGRSDIRLEKKIACVGVRPVFGQSVFAFLVVLDELNNLLQAAMLADELQGGVRADFGDRIEVVAAEKDAQVDKL